MRARNLDRNIALAEGHAQAEQRLAERSEAGRKAAQKRVERLEGTVRDARRWLTAHPEIEEEAWELKRILGRPGSVPGE